MVFMGPTATDAAPSAGSSSHSKTNGSSPPVVDLEDSNETSNGASTTASTVASTGGKPVTRDSRDSREESGSDAEEREGEGQIRVGKDYQVNPTNFIPAERKSLVFFKASI